jgi:hypothetical protein
MRTSDSYILGLNQTLLSFIEPRQTMQRTTSISKTRGQGYFVAQLLLYCLVACVSLFCGARSAVAGVMLPSNSGVIASVSVETSGESDEVEDEATSKLELEISKCFGQHTSSGGAPSSSSSLSVFVGILPTQSDSSPVALIFRRQAEVSLNFTNPFLDGILRPPIA